jgi:hypothetical protein
MLPAVCHNTRSMLAPLLNVNKVLCCCFLCVCCHAADCVSHNLCSMLAPADKARWEAERAEAHKKEAEQRQAEAEAANQKVCKEARAGFLSTSATCSKSRCFFWVCVLEGGCLLASEGM